MGEKINPTTGIIFAGGEIGHNDAVLSLAETADYIIAADSGYHHCQTLGLTPDLLVGDFDSIHFIPPHIQQLPLPTDKNYTDTSFAIQSAMNMGCTNLILVGMLGGRLDHTESNIQSLVYCIQQGIDAFITDGLTYVVCITAKENETITYSINPRENYYFSLLSHSDHCQSVTIEGGKYPLDHYHLTNSDPRAVSNEFIGTPVTVTLTEGILLILLVPKDNQKGENT